MSSLKDIATALNLSIPLVSKVLSGRMGTTGCSEVNRKAILAKAEELNYRPNLIAQALRTGRTGSLGVFVHPFGMPSSNLIEQLLVGLSAQANAFNQRLWLTFYETDKEFLSRFTKTDREKIDGLLVAGVFHPRLAHIYESIEKNGIPVVTMFKNSFTSSDIANVFCDDFQMGYLPTQFLLKRGCRRIAHIRSMDLRYQGYIGALRDFGIKEDPALIYTVINRWEIGIGREAVKHWVRNGIEFDGLVTGSDELAFGAICELQAQGRRVPDDVKVFGTDDSPVCELSPVPISSICQQPEEIGLQAVNAIMKRIKNESAESVIIQPVLRLRASTGN